MPYYFSFEGAHPDSLKSAIEGFTSANADNKENTVNITPFFEQLSPLCNYLHLNISTREAIEFTQKIPSNSSDSSGLLVCFFDGNRSLNIQIGDDTIEISPPGAAILSHRSPFTIQFAETYKGFWSLFSLSAQWCSQHRAFPVLPKLLPLSALNIHYLHQLRTDSHTESDRPHLKRTVVINQLLYQFLSELLTESKQVNHNNSIEQVKQLLLTNLSSPLPPLEELAQLCSMSVSTFRARFQQSTGTSAKKFFYDAQMNFATRLLSEGFSIKEIAGRLGYANASNFIHAFKRKFGVSPLKHK